ncbi:hypothetical protein ICM05_09775 [Leucobacter sp. cx-42]|uniref:hypothetical protein n=1 Tax=unclassified Leucobacter TaxID=2621730 RepID=UPI00165D92C8|nr:MULTISPECIES: hypothetical protein [unclassified Leucobacter]MBC9954926.1 hypothetical protein [Leucobacter sp. cx-42]
MTFNPTPEQKEAETEAYQKHGHFIEHHGRVCQECGKYFKDVSGYEDHRIEATLVAAAGAAPQERAPIPATKPMRGYVQEFVCGYGAALYTLEEAVDRITLLIDPAEGWSDDDRHEALAEARRRWIRPDTEWTKRHFDGCINGFALGAEWQKAKMPALAAPLQVDEAKLTTLIMGKTATVAAKDIAEWLRGGAH